jgi:hypothetical protein
MSGIRVSTIGIAGLALGLCAAAGRAADAGTGWDQLQQLHPGDKVRVELHGKPDVTADFGAVMPDSLQLVRRQKEQNDIPRTEIRRVYRVLQRSRARAAAPWIGAAAGFGVGFAGGWAAGDPPSCQFLCFAPKPATGAVFGAVGAGLGALVGHFAAGKAEKLVYRAR